MKNYIIIGLVIVSMILLYLYFSYKDQEIIGFNSLSNTNQKIILLPNQTYQLPIDAVVYSTKNNTDFLETTYYSKSKNLYYFNSVYQGESIFRLSNTVNIYTIIPKPL